MKNILTIIKKELTRFFTDIRLVLGTLVFPGALIFIVYSVVGLSLTSVLNGSDIIPVVYTENAPTWFEDNLLAVLQENGPLLNSKKIEYHVVEDNLEDIKKLVTEQKVDVLLVFSEVESKTDIRIFSNSNKQNNTMIISQVSAAINIKVSQESPIVVLQEDLVPPEQAGASLIAMILPMILMSMLFSGCMAVTPESIAGEKERGTIATLLVTPIKRYELAVGKIVSITVIALASSLSSFIGTIASLPKMMAGESLNASLKYSVGSYFQILLVILSLVIVIVSVLGCISAFSKSIKEAGSYSTPLMIVAILVGITSMFSSGSSPWYFYLIPLYNGVRCLTDILTFSPNIIGLIIAVLSNFAYAVAFGFLLVKMFNSEKVMFQR